MSVAKQANIERVIKDHPLDENEKNAVYLKKLREKKCKAWPLENYVDTKTKISHIFLDCGHIYDAYPGVIYKGNGCHICYLAHQNDGTRISESDFIKKLTKNNTKVTYISGFNGLKNKAKFKCNFCGKILYLPPERVIYNNSGCKSCSIKKSGINSRNNPEEFEKRVFENGDDSIELLEPYVRMHEKILVRCKLCGQEYKVVPHSLLIGRRCQKCSAIKHGLNNRLSDEEISQRVFKINKYIEFNGRSESNPNKGVFECLLCGNIWEAKIHHIVRGDSGCPKCSMSLGEIAVATWLDNHNIEHTPQKKYDDLVGLNHRRLPYDFYLHKYNLLIEYDGEQHFKPMGFWGGDEKLHYTEEHDKIKTDYAKKNNIPLLRIKYTEDINEVLTKYLKLESVETVTVA